MNAISHTRSLGMLRNYININPNLSNLVIKIGSLLKNGISLNNKYNEQN